MKRSARKQPASMATSKNLFRSQAHGEGVFQSTKGFIRRGGQAWNRSTLPSRRLYHEVIAGRRTGRRAYPTGAHLYS
jgi:hypothetical protein